MEELLGGGFERCELIDAGVVDGDVELAEGFDGLGEETRDISLLRDVALHGDGFTARGGDSFDDLVGGFLARGVVDYDRCAFRSKGLGNSRANALRSAVTTAT